MSIADNYSTIKDKIAAAAGSCGRNPSGIQILSVCKTIPAQTVQDAIDQGIRVFGENKVQEAKAKIPLLKGDFTFHLIGHLQSNKARDAVKLFDVIHSVDKKTTAFEINREAEKIGKVQKILIQVNAVEESSKSGVKPGETVILMREIADYKNIEILGLMNMAPFTDDAELIKKSFGITKKLLDEINNKLDRTMRELSMGMSHDFEHAVRAGATMVRIGTAIFGERT